jgi:hypothetical protein
MEPNVARAVQVVGAIPIHGPHTAALSAPFAPFNSGSWTITYKPDAYARTTMPAGFGWRRCCRRNQFSQSRQPWNAVRLQAATPVSQLGGNPDLPARTLSKLIHLIRSGYSVTLKVQAANDVVFYFPRSNRELWANSSSLKEASPYFKTSLESAFKKVRYRTSHLKVLVPVT